MDFACPADLGKIEKKKNEKEKYHDLTMKLK